MNQKGFATIFGLCLILIIALVVKGIEETEMNHAYEVTDFQAEFELQNAADSGIHEAVQIALNNPAEILPLNTHSSSVRRDFQHRFNPITINSKHLGIITVETWGERMALHPYRVVYTSNPNKVVEDKARLEFNDKGKPIYKEIYVFFSRASADSKRMNGKIYRRAFAYVFKDDDDATIHFMEVPTGSYTFK